MKTKLILSLVVITVTVAVLFGSRGGQVDPNVMPVPPKGVATGLYATPPIGPADIEAAKDRLRASSELLQKQLLPLVKEMPGELKRVKELVANNERLIKQLAAMNLLPAGK